MLKCQQPKLNKSAGFTLTEVLVAISLSLVLFGALYGIYLTSYRSYRRSAAKAELNQNGRITLERISRDLRQAPAIVTTLPITPTEMNPAASSINFQDGHDTSRIQYVEYSLIEGKLHRKLTHYCFSASPESCDPSEWVASNATDIYGPPEMAEDEDVIKADLITSLGFYGNSVITADITAQDTNGGEVNFKTQVFCRNL